MAKFVFTTNFNWTSPAPECSKSNPPCSYMPMRRSFKKGDIIEGNVERNNVNSEPPNFFVSGAMRIGFGGRGSQIIMPVATTGTAIPIGQDNRGNSDTNKSGNPTSNNTPNTTNPTTAKSIFTTKNIVIGVLAIGAIFGILKITKKI